MTLDNLVTPQVTRIYATASSNMVKVTSLTLTSGPHDGKGATKLRPAVYVQQHRAGPHFGLVALLVDGIDNEAAYVVAGNGGGRDWSMATGCFIRIAHGGKAVFVPLHNRYEVIGGEEEGRSRRA